MKRFIVLSVVVILMVLCATPVLAAGLRLSPARVKLDVPADGSAQVEFTIYDFTGDLKIRPRDIPLRVEPTKVPVTAKEEGTKVVLTFYGDESLGSKIYKGKIRFMAETGGSVAVAIDVRATITNLVEGETPVLATPEESQPPPEESMLEGAPTPQEEPVITIPPTLLAPTVPELPTSTPSPLVPPLPTESNDFPIIPVAGIAASAAIVITLILVFARRRGY